MTGNAKAAASPSSSSPLSFQCEEDVLTFGPLLAARPDLPLEGFWGFVGLNDLWLYLCRCHSCRTFSSDAVVVIPEPPFNLQRHSVTADHWGREMNGSIGPLKAWQEGPGPSGPSQVTGHNEWGVVYVVTRSVTESFNKPQSSQLLVQLEGDLRDVLHNFF